jgi:hypothetical protein
MDRIPREMLDKLSLLPRNFMEKGLLPQPVKDEKYYRNLIENTMGNMGLGENQNFKNLMYYTAQKETSFGQDPKMNVRRKTSEGTMGHGGLYQVTSGSLRTTATRVKKALKKGKGFLYDRLKDLEKNSPKAYQGLVSMIPGKGDQTLRRGKYYPTSDYVRRAEDFLQDPVNSTVAGSLEYLGRQTYEGMPSTSQLSQNNNWLSSTYNKYYRGR